MVHSPDSGLRPLRPSICPNTQTTAGVAAAEASPARTQNGSWLSALSAALPRGCVGAGMGVLVGLSATASSLSVGATCLLLVLLGVALEYALRSLWGVLGPAGMLASGTALGAGILCATLWGTGGGALAASSGVAAVLGGLLFFLHGWLSERLGPRTALAILIALCVLLVALSLAVLRK